MDAPVSPVDAAVKSWKTVHDQLVHFIDVYASACGTLQFALFSVCPSSNEDYSQFDAILLTIENKLQRLKRQHEQVLAKGIASLSKARNLSYTLVPVNRLPQSLLLSAFSHVIDPEYAKRTQLPQPHYQDGTDPKLTISSVCSGWRRLVLESPTLWSTILFERSNKSYQLGKQSLARTGDAPIHIQTILTRRLKSATWLRLLRPRYDIIRSLDLIVADVDSLRKILAIWPNDSSAPSLRSCCVKILKTMYRTDTVPTRVLSDQVHGQFLERITRFSLCGGYFDWNSAALASLEHLELAWIAAPGPTLSQMLSILIASPRLRTLCLVEISTSAEVNTRHVPVHLDHLEKLVLMTPDERVWAELLPLLSLGSHPLTIHLGYPNAINTTTIGPLVDLLQRSYVMSMYLHHQVDQTSMAFLLAALPRLGYLYCALNLDTAQVLKALSSPPLVNGFENSSTRIVPCPELHTICFSQCSFVEADGWGLVTDQPNLAIELDNCFCVPTTELTKLAFGTVTFKYLPSRLPSFFALDGVDHYRIRVRHEYQEVEDPNGKCQILDLY